jgi:hypothetical protein
LNIFYLDHNIEKCAQYHIDKHIVKMPLETAQLLTTTIWVDRFLGYVPRALSKTELGVINTEKANQPAIDERTFTRYLPTHPNHPCAIWARTSEPNYEWLWALGQELCSEYTYRYGKYHASQAEMINLPVLENMQGTELTVRPQSMPEEYKQDDVVEAYRLYYMMDKHSFAKWKRRDPPPWWEV